MPWELTVRSEMADPSSSSKDWPSLGPGEEVCRRITECLPTVRWRREPSFIEQHEKLPENHPIRRYIESLTPEQKEWSSRPQFKGLYEGEGFTLEFFFTDGPVSFFHIDVRGGGNPMPALASLCRANQWAIRDVTGKRIDLGSPSAKEWEAFTQWRDRIIEKIAEERQTEDTSD
jgi:hypothetical protein